MFIIRFHGGLGNQMFEYCFYRYMQEYVSEDLKADLTWFDRNYKEHQGYELDRVFGIQLRTASYKEIAKVHEYYPRYYPLALFRYLARKYAAGKNRNRDKKEGHIFDFGPTQYQMNPVYLTLDRDQDWYIEGVFCSDAYFQRCEDALRQELQFCRPLKGKNLALKEEMESRQSVAVHVRRGDYVGNAFDIVGPEYYKSATEYIKDRVSDPIFYVFSDDMDYIAKEFTFLGEYIPVHNQGKESYIDMQLMSCCRHMIIANSTFSYWGALLGEKDDSIVIAPARYKADEDVALARKNWILLSTEPALGEAARKWG